MNSIPPPAAPWAGRRESKKNARWLPQAIGHRGYKAAFPENTMAAFRSAIEVGAHAIETDVHLSKDGVVVLSHDATLKRCFGKPLKVAECDWEYLSTLRTLREPTQPLPRLVDLLEYLAQPEQAHIWLLLDIKTDDNATELLSRVAAAIASIPAAPTRPWNQRIMLGPWDADWVAGCLRHVPGFPIALVAFSPVYASAVLPAVPNLNVNLFNYSFATSRSGSRLRMQARRHGGLVLSWSDNEAEWMALSLRNGVDGVITDDPKLFLEMCDRWAADGTVREGAGGLTVRQWASWVVFNFLVYVFVAAAWVFKGSPRKRVSKALGV